MQVIYLENVLEHVTRSFLRASKYRFYGDFNGSEGET